MTTPTGREPSLPGDNSITGREPGLGGKHPVCEYCGKPFIRMYPISTNLLYRNGVWIRPCHCLGLARLKINTTPP